ncbi:conserved hypothetical protein, partial [methanotrophic bacterial endosymbiont of Bathymodiolus sp.]
EIAQQTTHHDVVIQAIAKAMHEPKQSINYKFAAAASATKPSQPQG